MTLLWIRFCSKRLQNLFKYFCSHFQSHFGYFVNQFKLSFGQVIWFLQKMISTVCFFFMPNKVNANFTYLYLIEINDWCLIFSSMLGHLIIYKEIQILIIMLLVKLENLKLVGFQFCRVETRIYCYTKLSIFCFVLFRHYK